MKVLALFLILSLPALARGNETSTGNALRLVRAIQLDRAVLTGMRSSLMLPALRDPAKSWQQDKGEIRFSECLMALDSSLVTDILADGVAQNLSKEEIDQALLFYESQAGQIVVEQDTANLAGFLEQPGQFVPPKRNLRGQSACGTVREDGILKKLRRRSPRRIPLFASSWPDGTKL
jgi:hypothetical protein